METLWKDTVYTGFQAIRPKFCGTCDFPQNFHTRKLDEITVFYAVLVNLKYRFIISFTIYIGLSFFNEYFHIGVYKYDIRPSNM